MNFFEVFITIIYELISYAIIARILFSWLGNPRAGGRVYEFLVEITEPLLGPAKRAIPPIGNFDVSAIFVLLALGVAKNILVSIFG